MYLALMSDAERDEATESEPKQVLIVSHGLSKDDAYPPRDCDSLLESTLHNCRSNIPTASHMHSPLLHQVPAFWDPHDLKIHHPGYCCSICFHRVSPILLVYNISNN